MPVRTEYKQPVFIVGLPRSGTTLLQAILCRTGNYFSMPETHFFSRVTYGLPERNFTKGDYKKIQYVLANKSKIDVDEVSLFRISSRKELFEYILSIYNRENMETFLEKTPRHIFFYKKILEYYPDARFICMVREPKNAVSSIMEMDKSKKKSIIRLSVFYNKVTRTVIDFEPNVNVLIVRYEDLTNKPKTTVEDVCKFLDIEFKPEFVKNVSAPKGLISAHEVWKMRNFEREAIEGDDQDRWHRFLDRNQANVVSFVTKRFATSLGYSSKYEWVRVCAGISEDVMRLLSREELKAIFSRVHG